MDFRYNLLPRLTVIILLLGLCGCNAKHRTNYTLPSSTMTGAVVGGAAGIALSAATHGSVPLIIGGGVAAGGILGYLADSKTSLMFRLANAGVQVIQLGDTYTLVLPSDHFFDLHSPRLKKPSYAVLKDIARFIQADKRTSIIIEAYTDNVGDPKFKQRLSQSQAERIASFLWAHGVDFHRLHTVGLGKRIPIASNRTAFGSGMNRRVEIRLRMEADLA